MYEHELPISRNSYDEYKTRKSELFLSNDVDFFWLRTYLASEALACLLKQQA